MKKLCLYGWLCLLSVALTAGCAPPPQKQQKRFFWPMLSQDPKIEFIDFYLSDHDVKEGGESAFSKAILGREKPKLLFSRPFDVAADGKSGVVYVIDQGLHKVWVLDMERHEIRSLHAEAGQTQLFRIPAGIAVEEGEGVFVSDSAGGVIRFFDASGMKRLEIESKHLSRPTGLAYDAVRKRLYVTDTGRHQLLVFDRQGTFLKAIGERGGQLGQFNFPNDVAVDAQGHLIVLDALNARVQVFAPDGSVLRAFGERGTALGSFSLAKGVAVDSAGHVYVTDALSHKMVVFNLQGDFLLTIGGKHVVAEKKGISPGGFYLPEGIDVDSRDGIWVCDTFNRTVYKFQYLNDDYLREHPVRTEDIYREAQ